MPNEHPHVLMIMCDQFRFDAIAAHGNPHIRTPNLDRLVASGTSFVRAYAESPVCVPARAVVLTGRLPHQTGVVDNGTPLAGDSDTFVRAAADAGYHCEAIGKMHFQPRRTSHGFHRMRLSEEIPNSVADDDYLTYLHQQGRTELAEPHGVRHELYYSPQPSQLPEGMTTTAWTGRTTVDFIGERAQEPDRPWLCWTSFIKPHPPFDPPAPWYLMYDPLRMPDPVRDLAERERLLYQVRHQHRAKWTSADLEINRIRVIRAYYYALVSHVDHWIGEILDALERTGQLEDTLVIFTSDHGEYLGDHWAFGKRGFHDSAARIPYVISRPGQVPRGRRIDAVVGHSDLGPTICASIGARMPDPAPAGHDLTPLLQGHCATVRDGLVGQFSDGDTGLFAWLGEHRKYVYSVADEKELLLDVGGEDGETLDLTQDPAEAGTLRELRTRLQDRLRTDGFDRPLDPTTPTGWRWFPTPEEPGDPLDRDPVGRGRQYARWATPYPSSPVDLIGSPT
jgi:arylsulfatase